jgi:hypothetical protein
MYPWNQYSLSSVGFIGGFDSTGNTVIVVDFGATSETILTISLQGSEMATVADGHVEQSANLVRGS